MSEAVLREALQECVVAYEDIMQYLMHYLLRKSTPAVTKAHDRAAEAAAQAQAVLGQDAEPTCSCSTCNGRGFVGGNPYPCAACAGSGRAAARGAGEPE